MNCNSGCLTLLVQDDIHVAECLNSDASGGIIINGTIGCAMDIPPASWTGFCFV